MSEGTVYCLVDPRDGRVRYVGATTVGSRRTRLHRWGLRSDSPGKRRWARELRSASLAPTVLDLEVGLVGPALWDAERHWIRTLRNAGAPLLNVCDGGPGVPGLKRSLASIERSAAALRGVPKPRAQVLKMLAKKARRICDSAGCSHESIHDAARAHGIAFQNIWKVLKGRRPHAGGMTFNYEEA